MLPPTSTQHRIIDIYTIYSHLNSLINAKYRTEKNFKFEVLLKQDIHVVLGLRLKLSCFE